MIASQPDLVVRLLKDVQSRILTSPLSIAELASLSARRGQSHRIGPIIAHVRQLSVVRALDVVDYEADGRIHAAERAHHRSLGIVDAMLLAQAKADRATILTTDRRLAQTHQGIKVLVV